jgi:mannose/cellobiose epimerase-like protein (N-acyl-D-glucosamine 2-epimerase family)
VARDYASALGEIQRHLHTELLPFWTARGVDAACGGFLTYFDRDGTPTGETTKTLICQARCIYAYSAAHRARYGDGCLLEAARQGYEFLARHFWDDEHLGWYWTTDRQGTSVDASKLTYGQSFAIYALSEYAMASGDPQALAWADRTFDVVQSHAGDSLHGGYYEFQERDWTLKRPGAYGGDRKSMDVHMHLMEAFTNLYAASGKTLHRRKTREAIAILLTRILHPEHGTGQAQFTFDWKPLRAILFKDVWGEDRDVDDPVGRPLDNTSYGHNVEFGWLLHRAVGVLNLEPEAYKPVIRRLYDHCVHHGIDWRRGGVFCEGPHAGPARETNKEFWQQAETLVAMLDAVALFDDDRYWEAYLNVHRFVMDTMINHRVGEWFPLFSADNRLLRDHMAHAWKINYHTIRSMLECEARLKALILVDRRP